MNSIPVVSIHAMPVVSLNVSAVISTSVFPWFPSTDSSCFLDIRNFMSYCAAIHGSTGIRKPAEFRNQRNLETAGISISVIPVVSSCVIPGDSMNGIPVVSISVIPVISIIAIPVVSI